MNRIADLLSLRARNGRSHCAGDAAGATDVSLTIPVEEALGQDQGGCDRAEHTAHGGTTWANGKGEGTTS